MKAPAHLINDQQQLIRLAEQNMRGKLAYIANLLNDMTVTEFGHTLVVDSNMPSDTFNTTYGGDINVEIAQQVKNYYHHKAFPMAWWVGPSSQTDSYQQVLQQNGFKYDEYDVGMACDLTEVSELQGNSDKLTIKQCFSSQDFVDFGEVLASIFDPVDESVKTFYQKVSNIPVENRDRLLLLVGYEGDQAVATAAVYMSDEVAGIYDISTRPEMRGKGYGSLMFHQALTEAKARGYEISTLQASPDGLNIYKRMGFAEICEFHVWSNLE